MPPPTFKKFFYVFLDISGILLGVFLTPLGGWITARRPVPIAIGVTVLLLGIAAFSIHAGHYFKWRIARRVFGSDYFLMRNGGQRFRASRRGSAFRFDSRR